MPPRCRSCLNNQNSAHSGEVVHGKHPAFPEIDPEPCPLPPLHSGPYRSILPRNRAMTRLGECSFELELHILGYFISDVMKIAMLTIVKFGFMALLFPLKSSNI